LQKVGRASLSADQSRRFRNSPVSGCRHGNMAKT
jgi:hypothetical protein